ncbi:UNVERIFIED_CONTAM: hypothetical protein RMT77_004222 [Armadillidium vulgare]
MTRKKNDFLFILVLGFLFSALISLSESNSTKVEEKLALLSTSDKSDNSKKSFEFSFPKRTDDFSKGKISPEKENKFPLPSVPPVDISQHPHPLSNLKDTKSYTEEHDPFALHADEEDIYLGEESSNVFSIVLKQEIYVRKCCSKNESFIVSLNSCSPYELEFVVPSYVTKQNLFLNISSDQMHIQEGLLTACVPSILERNEFILFESGEIFSSELNEYFHPDNYCIENIVDDTEEPHYVRLTAAYCPNSNFPQPFDPNKVPVRKCCPQGEMVSSENAECTPRTRIADEKWSVPVEFQGVLDSQSINFTSLYEVVAGYPECVLKERGETLDSTWNYEVSESTGYLYIPKLDILTPSYCLDDQHVNGSKISAFAYICLTDENHRKYTQANPPCQPGHEFCVSKCCNAGELLDRNGQCVRDADYLMFPQSVPIHYRNGTFNHVQNIDFSFGIPSCGRRELFMTKEDERAEIMSDGGLRYVSYDPYECSHESVKHIEKRDYCYDLIRFEGHESHLRGPVPGALICYPKENESDDKESLQVNYIYAIFLTISDVFILISFVIYLTVPDQTKRGLNKNIKLGHSILGRILLSFLFSLFFAYLSLIVTKTASDLIFLASEKACIALGVMMYISFLATFFWLNVLCFELWWKCARQESTTGRRWLWYQIYAWGNPLLLGSIVLSIEFSPYVGPCFLKPNFGIHTCFFSETRTFGSAAKWVYLNGPVAILLITDLVFFLLTVKSLLQTVQQSHKGTVKRQARQRLKLCFKLFLVMGICWLTEIISAATSSSKWYIAEIFNCLQGFIIFLIFILKPKILHAVRERVCSLCCGQHQPRQQLRDIVHESSIVEVSLRSRSDRSAMSRNNARTLKQ